MLDLKRKNCLVTGGARGLGAETVRQFAAQGCNVAINYLSSKEAADKLAEDMRTKHGVTAVTIQGDMSKQQECTALVKDTISQLGGLDVLVSNAGNTKFAPFDDIHALSAEDWDYTWHVLTMANIWLLQEAQPTFNANEDGGCLLVMNSVGGLINNGSSMAYSVTRAATLHLTKCLAQTQGPKIRVNTVCPGWVATDRAKRLPGDPAKTHTEISVLKRVTQEREVADAFVFLARNTGMTGERIRVDSGSFIV